MKTILLIVLLLSSTANAEESHYSWDEPHPRSDQHNYALDDLERYNEQARERRQAQRDYDQRERQYQQQQMQMQQLLNELRR